MMMMMMNLTLQNLQNSYCYNIIGDYNITKILKNYEGKYVIVEIEEVEKPSWLEQTEN